LITLIFINSNSDDLVNVERLQYHIYLPLYGKIRGSDISNLFLKNIMFKSSFESQIIAKPENLVIDEPLPHSNSLSFILWVRLAMSVK